ncbi:MAG: RAD55 family ATPase [Candidatus Hodarchaeales archaeon]|jgi:KaiC/GvpD/RAD55 family RecA-like ATPase
MSKSKNSYQNDKRVASGLPGLDPLLMGGFKPYTVNVIVADTGCGKSTFCWQYTAQESEKPIIFVSLEQPMEQMLSESKSIGIEGFSSKHSSGILHFIYGFSEEKKLTAGEFARNFLTVELPRHINDMKDIAKKFDGGLRIAIDPITPLLFEIDSLSEQRDIISRAFKSLRKIGTTIITLEKGFGEEMTRVPLFLADSIIDLDFVGLGSVINRTLKIRKIRGSSHSENVHPITFEKGSGLVVHSI